MRLTMSDKDIKSDILGIFPTPLYVSQLEILNEEELSVVNEYENKIVENTDGGKNFISEDTDVLNNLKLKNLKQKINIRIEDYFKKIICTNDFVEPYITQSWLNFNYQNTSHNEHIHRNSIISGVYYVKCQNNLDSITFVKNRQETFAFGEIYNYNDFNSTSFSIKVRQGLLIIFPSNLIHTVDLNKFNNTRISLPFNVFVSGTIGKKRSLTQLTFKTKE